MTITATRPHEAYHAENSATWQHITGNAPPKARAVIVAVFDQDDCELQSDYHGRKQLFAVALGYRASSRESFRSLRRAAERFPQTAHLAPGNDHWKAGLMDHAEGCYRRWSPLFLTEERLSVWLADNPAPEGCTWKAKCYEFEHRENYSMGEGNYLKAGGRYSTGWRVVSMELDCSGPSCPVANLTAITPV